MSPVKCREIMFVTSTCILTPSTKRIIRYTWKIFLLYACTNCTHVLLCHMLSTKGRCILFHLHYFLWTHKYKIYALLLVQCVDAIRKRLKYVDDMIYMCLVNTSVIMRATKSLSDGPLDWLTHWLIDCFAFYAVSAIIQACYN